MSYSIAKAREIEHLWQAIGLEATALQLNISEDSVGRACRYVNKADKALEEYEESLKPKNEPYDAPVDINKTRMIPKVGRHDKDMLIKASKAEDMYVRSCIGYEKPSVVGIIGDLHAPFDLDAYFFHCVKTFAKHKCDKIVFIGDVIDNHFSSYHETDPDGLGGGRELEQAIRRLERWYDAFPKADVIIGNHCRLIRRKAFSGGVPKRWIKEFGDVLNVPEWEFSERVVHDGIQYVHGESGKAIKKAKDDMMSTVQGHRHTEMGVEWAFGANFKVFGMGVGCGIDIKSYAMAYGKNFKKPAIGCGVVFEGKTALNIPMEL